MVFRLSTTKIVSRPIDSVEEVIPKTTFTAIDTYIETSRKDEFILGNLFDYNGNKINYIWDSKKHQIASLKGKNLNTEIILSCNEFLRNLYRKPESSLDPKELLAHIVDTISKLAAPRQIPAIQPTFKELFEEEDTGTDFLLDYENDQTPVVFAGEFLEDDEEVDDFDEQLALKSQEFLKEHPELKTEMNIVRLLEGN